MLLETAVGGALGGLLRLAPEVMKVWDRGNERKHELALLDKNTEAEKARAAAGLRETEIKTDSAQMIAGVEALKEAIAGQAAQTGIKWVDAMNQTVRPILTYGIAAPYAIGKMLVFLLLVTSGVWHGGLSAAEVKAAVDATYQPADMAILAGVLNFWFLGRVFDKRS